MVLLWHHACTVGSLSSRGWGKACNNGTIHVYLLAYRVFSLSLSHSLYLSHSLSISLTLSLLLLRYESAFCAPRSTELRRLLLIVPPELAFLSWCRKRVLSIDLHTPHVLRNNLCFETTYRSTEEDAYDFVRRTCSSRTQRTVLPRQEHTSSKLALL